MKPAGRAVLAAASCAVAASSVLLLCSPAGNAVSSAAERRLAPPPAMPAPRPPDHILVQLFRGHTLASRPEISITTIFRERSFTVLADTDVTGGSEEDLRKQVREIFSLKEVASLGSSIVALSGGSALLDDNGHRVEIHIEGQPLGGRTVRLIVSELIDGEEVVGSSVIARAGKTIVLAGPAAADGRGDLAINFVCLTPFS